MIYPTDTDYKKWLHTARWRTLRITKLSSQPWCEECLKMKRRTLATEVHHKQPVLSFPSRQEKEAMMFNPNNLMSLCHTCHMAQHDRKLQKSNQQQRAMSKVEAFKARYKSPTSPSLGSGEVNK